MRIETTSPIGWTVLPPRPKYSRCWPTVRPRCLRAVQRAGRSASGGIINWWRVVRVSGIATVLCALNGCDGAPSRNILGSYFPSWMVCALFGVALALAAHAGLKGTGLLAELPVPFVVMLAIACAGSFALWLVWLA